MAASSASRGISAGPLGGNKAVYGAAHGLRQAGMAEHAHGASMIAGSDTSAFTRQPKLNRAVSLAAIFAVAEIRVRRIGPNSIASCQIATTPTASPRSVTLFGLAPDAAVLSVYPPKLVVGEQLQAGVDSMPAALGFRVLGELEVTRGPQRLPLTAGKLRTLLAILLIKVNQTVPVAELIDRIWEADPPHNAKLTLQTYVMRLRRALGDDGGLIQTRPGGYLIELAGDQLDLLRFRDLVERAGRQDGEAAVVTLREALALWRGPALADVGSESLRRDEASALTEERLFALDRRIQLDIDLGRADQLIGELSKLTREFPLRERFWHQLMQALYQAGRPADSLRAYREARELLVDELGIEPGPALHELHEAILRNDLQPARPAAPAQATPQAWVAQCQLPLDVGDFVGRTPAIDELVRLLTADGAVPVVTVSGPPGVGKSALAVHVGHRLREVFPDGQWFLRLGGAGGSPRDPADALSELLRTAGVDGADVPASVDARAALLRARLTDRRVLLLLDDAAGAEQVRPLLPGVAGSAVLVTSRSELSALAVFEGGRGVRLDGLDAGEAGALLTGILGEHALRVDPPAAAELVQLCGRLPLALRIAAANLSVRPGRSITDYVGELRSGDRLAKLAVTGDPQTAVRASFDLSYRALAEPARRLFRLLGLIPGPDFGVDAAAALLGDGAGAGAGATVPLLDQLATANLVQAHAADRYRLHDLLRLYAAEHARSDPEREPAWRRLCHWYARTTEAATGIDFRSLISEPTGPVDPFRDGDDARAWLAAELPNVIAIAEQAAELGPDELVWRLPDLLRVYLHADQVLIDHLSMFERGLQAAERAGDLVAQAIMQVSIGLAYWSIGDIAATRAQDERSLELFRRAGHVVGERAMLVNIAIVVQRGGDSLRSLDLLTEAASLRAGGVETSAPRAGLAMTSFATAYTDVGELDRALECSSAGLEIDRECRRRKAVVDGLLIRANLQRLRGRHERAWADLTEAMALIRAYGVRSNEPGLHTELALLCADTGRLAEARSHGETALRLTQERPDRWLRTKAFMALGAAVADDPWRCAEHYEQARRLAEAQGYRGLLAEAAAGLAEAGYRRGDHESAVEAARRSLAIARPLGHRLTECRALSTLSQLSAAAGDQAEAAGYAAQAVEIREAAGHRPPARQPAAPRTSPVR